MRCSSRLLFILLLAMFFSTSGCVAAEASPSSTANKASKAAADRLAKKLQFVQTNGMLEHPDQRPTVMTQDEINAYLAEGRVKLPIGVQKATFQLQPGIVTAKTQVDFDQLKAGRSSSNPLLGVFSGVHDVRVVAHAKGSGGSGKVQVESVVIDDVQIPRIVLELFVNKVLRPKYPKAALDSEFKLPAKIDLAIVGKQKLTLTQK